MNHKLCVKLSKTKKSKIKIHYRCLTTLDERYSVIRQKREINYIVIKKFFSPKQWIRSLAKNPKAKAELQEGVGSFKHKTYYLNKIFSNGELYWVFPAMKGGLPINFGECRVNAEKELSGYLITKQTLNYIKSLGKKVIEEPSIEVIW